MSAVDVGCRILLFGVFLVSAASKIRSVTAFRAFASSLVAMRLVRPSAASTAAAVVATTEILIVGVLAVPATGFIGFVAAAALLVTLSAGIVVSLSRGADAPCRCFGASSAPLGKTHVARNAALLAVACAGAMSFGLPASHSLPSVVVAVFLAAMGLVGVLFFDDLVALFRSPADSTLPARYSPSPRQGVSP